MISLHSRTSSATIARTSLHAAALALPLLLSAACTNTPPHTDPPPPAAPAATPSASTSVVTNDVDAAAPPDASTSNDVADASDEDAAEAKPARPYAKDNKILPLLESDELTQRAKQLLDAIAKDDPALGESFWFPKEPFIPLKDVKGPDKYWDNLHATYVRDIHKLHRKRKSWEGVEFVSFKVGSTPKWVPPGDEANKIGYYRSFRGKLTYRQNGKNSTLDVHTIISWQGEWFITHLSKFKKK